MTSYRVRKAFLFAISLLLVASILISWCTPRPPKKPKVAINSPPSGTRVDIGEELEVQSTATDEKGVNRVELWVDGALVRSDTPPSSEGQRSFSVVQRWTPDTPGSHILEVKAYDVDDLASEPAAIMVVAVSRVALPTPTVAPPMKTPTEAPTTTPTTPP